MERARGKPEGWQIPYLPGALVVLPPQPVRARIDRLRRRYDHESAARIPAHVSIAQPFRAEPDRAALDRVREVLAGFKPFEMRYGPLRNFLPYPCIWYEVQPAELLLAMRRALHGTGLFNTDLPHTDDFIPHMSLTDGTPGTEETSHLFDRLKNRVKSGSFPVDRVVFTRPDWQFRFLVVEEMALGVRQET